MPKHTEKRHEQLLTRYVKSGKQKNAIPPAAALCNAIINHRQPPDPVYLAVLTYAPETSTLPIVYREWEEKELVLYPWLQYFSPCYILAHEIQCTTTAAAAASGAAGTQTKKNLKLSKGPPFTYFPLLCYLDAAQHGLDGLSRAIAVCSRAAQKFAKVPVRNCSKFSVSELRLLHAIMTRPGSMQFVLLHLCYALSAAEHTTYRYDYSVGPDYNRSALWNVNIASAVAHQRFRTTTQNYAQFFLSDVCGPVERYYTRVKFYTDNPRAAIYETVRTIVSSYRLGNNRWHLPHFHLLNVHLPHVYALFTRNHYNKQQQPNGDTTLLWLLDPRRTVRWNQIECSIDPFDYVRRLADLHANKPFRVPTPHPRWRYLCRDSPCVLFSRARSPAQVSWARQAFPYFDALCKMALRKSLGARRANSNDDADDSSANDTFIFSLLRSLTATAVADSDCCQCCCDEQTLRAFLDGNFFFVTKC